jgi:UDP-N-acetylglucosamine--N-acetylmuramyl-(pentapeptide) pyrophosphoryl-undecaprenol N-acetylglucosamine transferase
MRVLFAGGGTGGHLFPAIAIAEELRRQDRETEIMFVGTKKKIEGRVVPERGFMFASISISGFRRTVSIHNLVFPVRVIVSFVQSILLILRFRPSVVVGTGGYVCGPPLFAAWMLRVPTLLQEQNSYPGVTTRMLARCASEVHLSFASTLGYLSRRKNVFVTGNPVRQTIGRVSRKDGAAVFGIDPERLTLLVFGGSLGARGINTAMLLALPHLNIPGLQVIWQTGEHGYSTVRSSVPADFAAGKIVVLPYIERMESAYAASDLVLCRAGATSVAELASAGMPAILVPYPFAAADHQTENARVLATAGAAVIIPEASLDRELPGALDSLLRNRETLRTMAANAKLLAKPDAAGDLADAITRLGRMT